MEDGGERGADIAVIGLAARFPGAPDADAFWRNLCEGVESIAFFDAEAAAACGVDRELLARPDYVRAHGALADVDLFDAAYFGYSPGEAELMDPQQRIFLEIAVEALERAGYAGGAEEPVVGVYAGAGENTYLLSCLAADPGLIARWGPAQVLGGAQADYLATRVSYKLDLRGPSFTVKTACSTSLVAVHLACQGLLSGECDVALAGAVSVWVPQEQGYLHEDDGVLSPDGHCRAFDAAARGTVPASGAGAVVLRRLDEALEAGDPVEAVIRGSVINNDGSAKAGFSAPSVEGQAMAIRTAHLVAGVEPGSIGYVETHGTATPLGDPIEVAALEQAFDYGPRSGARCALGSVKTNIGHCGAAAGIAGLIKTVLAVKHGLLPPSLHFARPNPRIDFEAGPFRVQTRLGEWPALPGPRRAGVSSFGIGGTNAHVIVEEAAPPAAPPAPSRPFELIVLSARTESALERLTDALAGHLGRHPELPAADVAYTLQVGRRAHGHRRAVVARGREDAVRALASRDPRRLLDGRVDDGGREVFFLFSGLGDQYPGMGKELYDREPVFRDAVDRCCRLLAPRLGRDLRRVLYPPEAAAGTPELERADLAQPAVFVTGYALAELWRTWGIRCRAALGYSLGEYLAAWQAGVFSLEDALFLVAERARLIQELPAGAMLAVPLGADELRPRLGRELSLAAYGAPSMSVAAGPPAAVAELRGRLAADGVAGRLVRSPHALHTEMMAPIAARFAERLAEVRLEPPRTPYVSNVTGTWVRPEEATDPDHWVRHLRCPVRFSEGVGKLLEKPGSPFLEIGPGNTLATLVRQHADPDGGRRVVTSLGAADSPGSDTGHLLRGLGLLWLSGAAVDWPAVHRHQRRPRVALPTYPFERRRYWLLPGAASRPPAPAAVEAGTARHDRPGLATPYAAPASPLETAIAGLWQKVLGLARVGIHDDFFELGGHSFLAVRLLAEIRDELGEELPLSAVFRAPTVARMAALVAGGGDLGVAAVPIQPSGSRPPFFCAAPVLGTVFPYYDLARNLGKDQPFYGLQPPSVALDGPLAPRIEDQAAHFIAALKEIQDTGPYYLGGWSYGTLVAYEMARQLEELGEEVGLVALFDAPAPVPSQRLSPWALVKLLFDVVVRDFAPYVRDYLYLLSAARRAGSNGRRRAPLSLRLLAEGAAMAAVVPPESRLERLRPPQVRAMLRAMRENNRAAAGYRPSPFAGRVTLFRTGRNGDRDPGLGWGELAGGGVDVKYVPGNHMNLLRRPHVETLAGMLAECLQGRGRSARPTTRSR